MVSKSFALLALSSLAIAKPHGGHNHQHPARHPHGTAPHGSGRPRPTGGMFPGGRNGTWGDAPFPIGSGAGSVPVVTQTVVPVPGSDAPAEPTPAPVVPGGGEGKPEVPSGDESAASPPAAGGAPGGGKGEFSPPTNVNNNIGGGAGDQCVPLTETSTKVEYVTVTAGAEAASPSDEGETELVGDKDVSAGQFFGVPTGGYGGYGGHGGQGGNYGQSDAQPQPTTFATMPTGGYGGGAPSATGGAPAVPTQGSGSASGNSTGGGAASGGKRGLSFNDAGILSAFDGAGMSWAYNWADSESGALPSGVEYVPMCWGPESIDTCGQNAAGAQHVLSFNEPDLGEQADMTPEAAAQGHIKALNPLAAQGARIGSPAITNGGAPMGTAWLQSWFDACGGQCKVDFVTFHWYDSASNFAYFQQHVEDVIAVAQKNGVDKVWCTEFGVTSGDAASFIDQATAYLDQTPQVERYAYFMAAEGNLIQGGGLSAAGKAYAGQ